VHDAPLRPVLHHEQRRIKDREDHQAPSPINDAAMTLTQCSHEYECTDGSRSAPT
jgi:hypothetical protein